GLKRAQVDRWRPGRDPLREDLPDRRREREPAAVAPRRTPEAPNLWRWADEEPAVRGHGEEAATVLPHRALLDGRHLARDLCGEPGQHSEVERDVVDREAGSTRVDWQRIGLEAAQHEPAARRPEVDRGVDDPHDRVVGPAPRDRLADVELVTDGGDRRPHAGEFGHRAGPRARRIDDDPSADLAGGRGHAFDLTPFYPDSGDGRIWNEGDALAAAGLQIRLEQARRLVDVDVARGVTRGPD